VAGSKTPEDLDGAVGASVLAAMRVTWEAVPGNIGEPMNTNHIQQKPLTD